MENILTKFSAKQTRETFNTQLTKRLKVIAAVSDNLYKYSNAYYQLGMTKPANEYFEMARKLKNTMFSIQSDYKAHLEVEIEKIKRM